MSTTNPSQRREPIVLVCLVFVFLLLRLPVIAHAPGGEDEDVYALPGLTIFSDGIPRLSAMPARNPESCYFHADMALYAEPPLSFYVQGMFYALLPDTYGTARLVSLLSGIWLAGVVFVLARKWTSSPTAALWGAGLLLFSRWMLFPAIKARPDLLCAVFGVTALWSVTGWQETRARRWLVATGVLIGLGGLTHFFAIVYAIQIGVWIWLTSRGWRRCTDFGLVAIIAICVATLWIPMILRHPDIFQAQLAAQFLEPRNGSWFVRLFFPWEPVRYHFTMLAGHLGSWQSGLLAGSLLAATVSALRHRSRGLWTAACLTGTGFVLMAALVGVNHPVVGYWIYPAASGFVCVGWLVDAIQRWLQQLGRVGQVAGVCLGGVIIACSLPGTGLMSAWVYIRHWNDVNYNAPLFARELLRTIPEEARCTVDTEFLLDFVAAGRPTVWARSYPKYLRAEEFPYDILIVSRYGLDPEYNNGQLIAERLNARLLRQAGLREEVLGCYAEICVPGGPATGNQNGEGTGQQDQ